MKAAIYPSADIRRIEQAFADVSPPLMERAGEAAAELAVRLVKDNAKDVLVLAGPGNNGGDARVVARRLEEAFFRVCIATRPGEIPERPWALVIDGLFGIGLARELSGDHAAMVDHANRQSCPILALDVPSGIDADTGRVLGRAVRATHTITFIALKPGLLTLDGPDHCGEITVADLGLSFNDKFPPGAWVANPASFRAVLRARPANFHKGLAGTLAILGGAPGMTGATLLAGRAALCLGAGRVRVGFLDERHPSVDPQAAELMLSDADLALGADFDAAVVGPGLGTSERAETILAAVLASDVPCVLDADALNILAETPELREACARRKAETLLTPHPAEAGRLLAESTATVQADRVKAARALSTHFNAHVVLKGNGSILAARDGHWFINATGNPGMASAGMGDVLAGMLGALLAQRYSGETSLVLGTHLHGAAADALVKEGTGPVGITASELLAPARKIWNGWLRG